MDDAVQEALMPQVNALLNRRNPNGCRAKGTWFAQGLYTNPFTMTQFYAQGHEIADHSFTHSVPFAGSREELEAFRSFANRFGGIPRGRIKGVRFPFRNYTQQALEDLPSMGFEYDSSTATNDMIWPYTLDHGVVTECLGQNSLCGRPLNARGLWEVPMYGITSSQGQHLMDIYNDYSITNPISPATVTEALTSTFNRHYNGNRAPFGIYTHPVWLGRAQPSIPDGAEKLAAVNRFLDEAGGRSDVWFVTTYQLVQYMRNPVPASQLGSQPYMQCFTGPTNICNGVSQNGVESCGLPSGNFQVFLC
jgi:peptidoglycan/xylan/chitin deacetylase (PgdA/CDA1 family)